MQTHKTLQNTLCNRIRKRKCFRRLFISLKFVKVRKWFNPYNFFFFWSGTQKGDEINKIWRRDKKKRILKVNMIRVTILLICFSIASAQRSGNIGGKGKQDLSIFCVWIWWVLNIRNSSINLLPSENQNLHSNSLTHGQRFNKIHTNDR